MGHPVLRASAEPVANPADPEITRLIEDMVETMQDAGGTGLAAPQVHVPLQVVVYFTRGSRLEEGEEEVPLTALINPQVTTIGSDIVYGWEGCLSVPGLTGLVPRPSRVRLQALQIDGSEIDAEIGGFHARVLQHEIDHLYGILYPQRMDDLSLLVFQEEMRHGMPEAAQKLMERETDE